MTKANHQDIINQSDEGIFKVFTLLKSSDTKNTMETNGEATVAYTVEQVLRLLKSNPKLPVRELTQLVGSTRRGVEYHISKLQKSHKLKRIGPTKGGHWKVIE